MLLATSGFDTTALEEAAWELYCEETAGDLDVRDYWDQLSVSVKIIYISKIIKGVGMKITKISYSRLVSNASDCSNETFGAEAELLENESLSHAIDELKSTVNNFFDIKDHRNNIEAEIIKLKHEKECFEFDVKKYRKKATAMVQFLNDHGVEISTNDIPF